MSEAWGVTPAEVRTRLHQLEWQNRDNLRARLAGERPFPIVVALRPPAGSQAVGDVARFRSFVGEWRAHPLRERVTFEKRGMRGFDEQDVPVRLELRSMDDLARLLGAQEQAALERWTDRLEAWSALLPGARREIIRRLSEIDALPDESFAELTRLIPQLQPRLGRGGYVRSLPLDGVGTKVIEENASLLEGLIRAAHGDPAIELFEWLDVIPPPTATLLVRVLDPAMFHHFAGLPTLWTTSRDVYQMRVPEARIVIVENAQCVLGLPEVPGAIALGATGRDLGWLAAPWLRGRACCYWGDIDSWGFHMLEMARKHCPNLPSLLMGIDTLQAHADRRSKEAMSYVGELGGSLTQLELDALKLLRASPDRSRLEQEKIPAAEVAAALRNWIAA